MRNRDRLAVKAKIVAAEAENGKAPDSRVFARSIEFGAPWRKDSREGKRYLSVKPYDPRFPSPIYVTLVEAEDGESFALNWFRCNGYGAGALKGLAKATCVRRMSKV